ncbi:major facilitator superfamily MFS_1 [Cyanobacterium stanieri PCC 7202]|uniref:Major facilitator superfamily MFS_1 n=1 Tax=Cyanobacterium stanieri (strain ATCC 29140 / PCC 7202) TaxID=292563 RepID=K9YI40_CYASC|nr:major facilitator superfamily MFS_1 [Cyanobacterium stanieri PCC 7202]
MKNFAQQLDESSITRPMWLLWSLSASLIALDGFDFFVIGIALPFLKIDFGLTPTDTAMIAVSAIAGALVGSLTLGAITDKIGRQKMLLIDVFLLITASLASALSPNTTFLIVTRFLVGVGIGADYPISVAYITENVPSRHRGRMVIGAFAFQGVGTVIGALTGIIVISYFQSVYGETPSFAIHYAWRWMLGIGVLLGFLVGILRLKFLLESPSYYISRGEYEKASESASVLLEKEIIINAETEPISDQKPLQYTALFSSEYRINTLFASFPWFLQDIATYGIGIFTPTIIAFLALNNEADFLVQQIKSAQGAIVVDSFLVLGFILAVLLINKWGRIFLQVTGFLGMSFGLFILATSSLFPEQSMANIGLIIGGFFLFNLFMNAGPNSTTFLLSGEVFPSSIRASGAGLAGAIAKAGAILGAYLLPIIQEYIGVKNVLFILCGCCFLGAITTYYLSTKLTYFKEK